MFADLAVDPCQCVSFRTVGGEFEREVCTLVVLRLERMQAGEMRAVLGVFVPVECRADIVPGRVSQNIDGGFCVRDAIEIQRGDDGDESVAAHASHRSKLSGRCAGNGPAHRMAPVDLTPRLTKAPTSAGIWKALTARPAQG